MDLTRLVDVRCKNCHVVDSNIFQAGNVNMPQAGLCDKKHVVGGEQCRGISLG